MLLEDLLVSVSKSLDRQSNKNRYGAQTIYIIYRFHISFLVFMTELEVLQRKYDPAHVIYLNLNKSRETEDELSIVSFVLEHLK
jgi:hypothetical protein